MCGELKGAIFLKKAFMPYWNSFIHQVGTKNLCGVSADKLFFVPSMTNMSFDYLTI